MISNQLNIVILPKLCAEEIETLKDIFLQKKLIKNILYIMCYYKIIRPPRNYKHIINNK